MGPAMMTGMIVNPVAGMGGSVGLKGSDGESLRQALERGAVPLAGQRARRALRILAARQTGARVVVPPAALGAEWLRDLDLAAFVVGEEAFTGSAADTVAAARNLVAAGCDLVVFAGGDGTARDVADSIPSNVGILGIPCGVKMHSAAFAVSPEAAGGLWADLVTQPERVVWDKAAEIVDIDENALRAQRLSPTLYGHAKVPVSRTRMQAAKGGPRRDWAEALRSAAAEIVAEMEAGVLYVVGPGSSAGAVLHAMGIEPSLLGVDAVRDGVLLARDAGARELDRLAGEGPVRIILGVTGRQGFLLGRGNQQISSGLIRRAGREGLIVIAAEAKLLQLAQPNLWVDAGDAALDAALSGYVPVRTDAGRRLMMRLRCAT